tara:strand:- start:242 stop:832 length:591 start_codon:yes stop_codon:yes gene_type:complete
MAVKWFTLASGNPHKSIEFNHLFKDGPLRVKVAPEKLEVDEIGETFNENAYLKAKAYYDKFSTPVISDDSGLVVSALPDDLGVKSARFGGLDLSDAGRTSLLLEKLTSEKDRSAYFVCVLCFYLNPAEVFFFEGRCSGSITTKKVGEEGFGYDPVFRPEGQKKTFAEDSEWKSENGHRAKAVTQAHQFFSGFFGDN